MTGSIRNFEKLNFTPKSSAFCFSQGQTSKYDRLAHIPRRADAHINALNRPKPPGRNGSSERGSFPDYHE